MTPLLTHMKLHLCCIKPLICTANYIAASPLPSPKKSILKRDGSFYHNDKFLKNASLRPQKNLPRRSCTCHFDIQQLFIHPFIKYYQKIYGPTWGKIKGWEMTDIGKNSWKTDSQKTSIIPTFNHLQPQNRIISEESPNKCVIPIWSQPIY